MNIYVFENACDTAVRLLWHKIDEDGYRYVKDIYELVHDGSYESLKRAVKTLFKLGLVGFTGRYEVKVIALDYDTSLEGKARKRTSKEINVISAQLKEL